jgi:hypothetical protein
MVITRARFFEKTSPERKKLPGDNPKTVCTLYWLRRRVTQWLA